MKWQTTKGYERKDYNASHPNCTKHLLLNSALSLEPPGLSWWHHNLVGLPTWEVRSLSPCWTPQSSLQVVTPLWDVTPVLQSLSLLCWLGGSKRPCQGAPRFERQRILDSPQSGEQSPEQRAASGWQQETENFLSHRGKDVASSNSLSERGNRAFPSGPPVETVTLDSTLTVAL